MPEWIGDLISLNRLDLDYSGITSLPSSIGRLHNLEELSLVETGLSCLPDEIGDLASLENLDLSGSCGITSLLPSIGRLHNLEYIASDWPGLLKTTTGAKEMQYALACNRARSRTGFGITNKESIQMTPKQWPLVLNRATRAFIGCHF